MKMNYRNAKYKLLPIALKSHVLHFLWSHSNVTLGRGAVGST